MIAAAPSPTTSETLDFSDVESTALLTLYGRAMESRSPDPILVDKTAEQLVERIDPLIAGSDDSLLRMLHEREIDPRLVVHLALRAQKYDQYALENHSSHPHSAIVNLGCGMDTRFQRIDNGRLVLFDLDLPEMIRFKHSLLQETDRYHMLASSVTDYRWMDMVASTIGSGAAIFLAEGLLMYLEPDAVKELVLTLQSRFPGSILACEMTNRLYVSGLWKKMTARKMQRRFSLGKGTAFSFGISSPDELESWNEGIEFIDQWSYFDSGHPKLGWMGRLGNISLMRNAQYTVRYRLK